MPAAVAAAPRRGRTCWPGPAPAQRAARAAAAGRLLTGRRWRVTSWGGGYLLATATGATRPVASLDGLWAAVRPSSAPATGEQHWARAPVPAAWDLQAAIVWVADAARAGTVTAAELPAGGIVEFQDGGAALVHPAGLAEIGVLGPDAETALADLLEFAPPGVRAPGLREGASHGHTRRARRHGRPASPQASRRRTTHLLLTNRGNPPPLVLDGVTDLEATARPVPAPEPGAERPSTTVTGP